jgi:hypothetical protein
MTLTAILKILCVILVHCSSILQNSSVVLKISLAILSNDYCGLTGHKAAHGSVEKHWTGVHGRAHEGWVARSVGWTSGSR